MFRCFSFQPNHLDKFSTKSLKTSSTSTTAIAATATSNIDNSETPLDSPDSLKETPLLAESGRAETNRVETIGNGSVTSSTKPSCHSRQSSVASSHSTESGKLSLGCSTAPNSVTASSEELGDCHQGIVVALHRKMVRFYCSFRANVCRLQDSKFKVWVHYLNC